MGLPQVAEERRPSTAPSPLTSLLSSGARHPGLVVAIALIVAVTTAALVYTRKPVYEASLRLLIAQPQMISSVTSTDLPVIADVIGATRARSIQTHAEQIKSVEEVQAALAALPADLRSAFPARASDIALEVSALTGTDVVRIRVRAPSPKAAAALANALGDVHVRLAQTYNRAAALQAADYVQQQSREEARQFGTAQQKLLDYRKRTGVYDQASERDAAMARLLDVRKQLGELAVTLAGVNASLTSLSQQAERQPSHLSSDTVQKLEEQAALLRSQQQSAITQQRELLAQQAQAERTLRQLDQQSYEVEKLNTEVDAHKASYERLAKQYRDLLVSSSARLANVSVFAPAELPAAPVSQHRTIKLLLALIVGAALGCAAALVRDRLAAPAGARTSQSLS